MAGIKCHGFMFYNQFDSANLGHIEYVDPEEAPPVEVSSKLKNKNNNKKNEEEKVDVEFNLWTKKDCEKTEFENHNRTWFYFGMKASAGQLMVKLNMVDLQRQGKMFNQGMCPVFRVVPGRVQWERIREKPTSSTVDDIFTMSFKYRTPENANSITYFAFTYPFSYTDLKKYLMSIDSKYLNVPHHTEYDIYYTRETVCHSLQNREVILITISSYHGITNQREPRLKKLFPDKKTPRPFIFAGKKVIFVSARVHPGETPGTFVFNGLLNLLLTRDDPIAIQLRKLYVFKLIPFLNPDGVALGHYRTDTRGVNLNRVYLDPNFKLHPPIYAARALIRYHHFGYEKEDIIRKCKECEKNVFFGNDNLTSKSFAMEDDNELIDYNKYFRCAVCGKLEEIDAENVDKKVEEPRNSAEITPESNLSNNNSSNESNLFLYIDLHGHASKKGIFMYGNHFDDLEKTVECLLLPKLMTINNTNFHFTACNFTEKNMYTRDKRDGSSREGSGRVAVFKMTGLIRSYTLECNYNTGRLVNILPPTVRELYTKNGVSIVPPKYTPPIYEEVGRSLGASILDLTGNNPCTRIPNSEYHTLTGVRDRLREFCVKQVEELSSAERKKIKKPNQTQGKNEQHSSLKTITKSGSKTRGDSKSRKTKILYRSNNLRGLHVRPQGTAIKSKSVVNILRKPIKGKFSRRNKNNLIQQTSSATNTNVMTITRSLTVLEPYEKNTEEDNCDLKTICVIKTDSTGHQDNKSLSNSTIHSSQIITSTHLAEFISNQMHIEAGSSKQSEVKDSNYSKDISMHRGRIKKNFLGRINSGEPGEKLEKLKRKKTKIK